MEDKRKFPRLNTLVDVVYNKLPEAKKERLSLASNISQGGICLIAYDPIKESEVLNVEMYVPEDKNPIRAVGKVAWVKEFVIGEAPKGKRFDVGIEFIKINQEDQSKIEQYLFSHRETPS